MSARKSIFMIIFGLHFLRLTVLYYLFCAINKQTNKQTITIILNYYIHIYLHIYIYIYIYQSTNHFKFNAQQLNRSESSAK